MAENNQTNAAIDNREIEAKLDHMKKQMDNFTQLGQIFQWNFLLIVFEMVYYSEVEKEKLYCYSRLE